jgi:hypothetical protein
MRIAACVFGLALLAGCASARRLDTTHVRDIQKGVTDKAQVTAWFGEPQKRVSPLEGPGGCVERWQWSSTRTVAGGSSMDYKVLSSYEITDRLSVDFDAAGKVCDGSYEEKNPAR